ncbi:MAG: hypothetical protein A2787_05775 [Omnitrophica WOR_2 bacterium RIFCSPHIGHO2_01_FULL_48_9]|nr:MAG: hypothetical protein A2787_05775 [Omnitrophica WOR_2 bacterium RIFCSPHIGHO2_01_FULL_48_9]
MVFRIQKVSDVGTGNPIVARMSIGIFEIIEFSSLDESKKERLKSNCFEIMNLLVLAEKTAKPILEEIAQVMEQIKIKGIETQSSGRCITMPSAVHIENARAFIKYAKQTLQKVAENINIIYGTSFDGPHFHKILDYFLTKFGEDFTLSKLLKDDAVWVKQIIDLRNEDEHPNTGKPFVSNFDIHPQEGGGFTIFLPIFFDGTEVGSAFEIFSHNLLTFAEEITIFSLTENFFPPIATVYEIPEAERALASPVRFRLGLREGIMSKRSEGN